MLSASDYVYFVSYKGITVKKFTQFRIELAKQSADCTILKNKLILKAAELSNFGKLASFKLDGDTAMISGRGDAGAVAKIIKDFNKTNGEVAPKGGMIEGEVLSIADVDAIAALPSKEVMQAMLLGVLQAPARNFVSLLNNAVAGVVNVVNNYKEKLEK